MSRQAPRPGGAIGAEKHFLRAAWTCAGVQIMFAFVPPNEASNDPVAVPVYVVPGGFHCSDYYQQNWAANAGVREIADKATTQIAAWVDEFYHEKGIKGPSRV